MDIVCSDLKHKIKTGQRSEVTDEFITPQNAKLLNKLIFENLHISELQNVKLWLRWFDLLCFVI